MPSNFIISIKKMNLLIDSQSLSGHWQRSNMLVNICLLCLNKQKDLQNLGTLSHNLRQQQFNERGLKGFGAVWSVKIYLLDVVLT